MAHEAVADRVDRAGGPGCGGDLVVRTPADRSDRAADPGGNSPLADRSDEDQRGVDDRRRGHGLEGDQRGGRTPGPPGQGGDRRWAVRLADVRPGSATV